MHKPEVSILVIEDHQDLRLLISEFLTEKGFRVDLASNGQEAIEILNHIQPSLIIMDLEMPVMSGQEFIFFLNQNLEAKKKWGSIPLVIQSGSIENYPEITPYVRAKLRKPISLDHLARVIQTILS